MNKRPGSRPEQRSGNTGNPVVVHSITGAVQPHSDDMDARIRRYLVSMAIRTICVVLVLVIDNPVRWVFAVLAIILPYVAVVMANAAGGRRGTAPPPVPINRIPLASSPYPGDYVSTPEVRTDASSERMNGESHERSA